MNQYLTKSKPSVTLGDLRELVRALETEVPDKVVVVYDPHFWEILGDLWEEHFETKDTKE